MNGNESVSTYMATRLITFKPDTDIWDALKVIVKNKISGGPVINNQNELVGTLSEADCMRVILEGNYNNQPGGKGTVSDFMNSSLTTIDVQTTLLEAAYSFAHSKYKRFPVLENGKLVGQISRSDVLRAIAKLRPSVDIKPDSWKIRMPMVNASKQGRHSGSA